MSAITTNWLEIIERLPNDSLLSLRNISWEEYEDLLDQVGEASYLRISYNDGALQIMTLSSSHENYTQFIESLIGVIRLRLRLNIRFFGSSTMKKKKKRKGLEPDACFYVQSADLIGNRMNLDFAIDPPPDIAVEVDIHHESLSKFPIYAALGVGEIWRFDGERLTIHLLEAESYVESEQSRALQMLTSQVLTDFLLRLPVEGELQTVLAFDQWLLSLS